MSLEPGKSLWPDASAAQEAWLWAVCFIFFHRGGGTKQSNGLEEPGTGYSYLWSPLVEADQNKSAIGTVERPPPPPATPPHPRHPPIPPPLPSATLSCAGCMVISRRSKSHPNPRLNSTIEDTNTEIHNKWELLGERWWWVHKGNQRLWSNSTQWENKIKPIENR